MVNTNNTEKKKEIKEKSNYLKKCLEDVDFRRKEIKTRSEAVEFLKKCRERRK